MQLNFMVTIHNGNAFKQKISSTMFKICYFSNKHVLMEIVEMKPRFIMKMKMYGCTMSQSLYNSEINLSIGSSSYNYVHF